MSVCHRGKLEGVCTCTLTVCSCSFKVPVSSCALVNWPWIEGQSKEKKLQMQSTKEDFLSRRYTVSTGTEHVSRAKAGARIYIIPILQFIHWAFSISFQCCSQCPWLPQVQFYQFSEQITVNLSTKRKYWECWQGAAEHHAFTVPWAMSKVSLINMHAKLAGS